MSIRSRHLAPPLAVLLVRLAAGPAALAEAPPLLTLQEAIDLALEHNPALAAEIAAAEADESVWLERKAARLPKVELEGGFLRTTHPVAVFGSLLSQERFGEESFAPAFLNRPPALSNFQERLSRHWPLWTGGRLTAAIEAGDHQRQAGAARRERARQELIYRVIERYAGAVVAARAEALAEETLETARAHVELVNDLFEAGLVVESDLLQARVRLSEVEETRARADADARLARAALNLELGRGLQTAFALPATLETSGALEAPAGLEEAERLRIWVGEARAGRPDLAAARARVEAARAAARAERRGSRPEVGLTGAYELNSPQLFEDDGSSWSLAVGLRWTAFDGGATRARTRRAEAELERAEQLSRLAAEGAALEVETAFREITAAGLSLAQTEKAVTLAARSLEIVSDRYREGLTTVVELLDAETALTGARTRELSALRDLTLAHAALELAVGRLSGGFTP